MTSSTIGWYCTTIGQLGRVVTGKTPPTKNPELFGSEYPFITPSDIDEGIRIAATDRFVSEKGRQHLKNYLLPTGAVCFVCIGATIGKTCVTSRPSFTNQQINSIIVDSSRHDPRFVYYLVSTCGRSFKALAGGAATPIINKTVFSQIELSVPPLPVQRKMAAILSAYDDLIENNLRRIKILEEMAQALYREWFVQFRFPGHESVRMVDSELGRIPEGWEVVIFTDIADVLSGGTPRTTVAEYWGGAVPFFTPRDAPSSFYVRSTGKYITALGLSKCNSRLYPKDTVFITARGTVGKVVMPASSMAMNQSCYALRGRAGIDQLYLYLTTMNCIDWLKTNTGGATFNTIVIDTFRRMRVARPPRAVIDCFVLRVRPCFDLILNLLDQNINLRRTRDFLLPRLISGELDVSELDIAVPEEVLA